MLINLSDVFLSEGKKVTAAVPLEITSFISSLGEFPIIESNMAEFIFTNVGKNKAKVEGRAELTFETECNRCLKKVPTKLVLTFDRVVASPDAAWEEDSEEKEDSLEHMEGCYFNVESFLYHEILVNWPTKILCQPDCKGICPICGKDKNIGECECDTFIPDPRMAAIKDIFNASKEV